MNTIENAPDGSEDPGGAATGPGRSADGLWKRILTGLKQADATFSRYAMAIALAEHGTRAMVLDQLDPSPNPAEDASSGTAGRPEKMTGP